jgi:flagellar motor switch protein FliG
VSAPEEISGHQRVAAFLLSLAPEQATAILRHLEEELVADVSRAMLELDPRFAQGVVEEIYREITRQTHGGPAVRPCQRADLERMLVGSFGKQRGADVLRQIEERRRRDRPFLAVEGRPPHLLARALEAESPAVIGLVLAHLAPAHSAEVLRSFSTDRALEIVRRMATMRVPSRAVLSSVAENLEESLRQVEADGVEAAPSERLRAIAELLNHSGPDIEKRVLESIASEDADMAHELREYMFTWEDIATIDKRSMQRILGTVDTKTLSLALKACSKGVEENVLGNLSSRVREMVAEERELAGAVPLTDVHGARDEIMKNIRAMIDAGEFRPTRAGEDLVT